MDPTTMQPNIKFDSYGNRFNSGYSNGNWWKREYDSDGYYIYSGDSTGFWMKWKHDSNGNRIYYENSKGFIEDNRPN